VIWEENLNDSIAGNHERNSQFITGEAKLLRMSGPRHARMAAGLEGALPHNHPSIPQGN